MHSRRPRVSLPPLSSATIVRSSNMATPELNQPIAWDQKGIPKSKRKLQKHLRSAGMAYVSRTGKLIPAKKVADELCQCPHKCDELVPVDARQTLFQHFYGLGEADLQNQFLRSNMDLRARLNIPETTGSGRPPRRITCKYLVPLMDEGRSVEVCQKAFVSAFVITTKRVRLQREKLISSLGLNSYRSHNRSKDKHKNPTPTLESNNNNNTITTLNNNTLALNHLKAKFHLPSNLSLMLPSACQISVTNGNEKSNIDMLKLYANRKTVITNSRKNGILAKKLMLEAQCNDSTDSEDDRDNLRHLPRKMMKISKRQNQHDQMLMDNPMIPFGLVVPEGVTIAPVIATADHDRDIAIVNNFFNNQLWKPEYIGAYS